MGTKVIRESRLDRPGFGAATSPGIGPDETLAGGIALARTRTWLTAALALAGAVSAARAADTPRVGPAPDWVEAAPETPAVKDDLKQAPLTILLNDTQFSFDPDGWSEFHHVRAKVQAAGGLQALGTIPFQWSPWSDTLTFHRADILRDGQTIDVLPKDGAFTVLRREPGLEQAMLTGELTALLQPEGMQVGDVLDLAVSIRHADPLLKGQAGAVFSAWDSTPVGRVRLAARWPSALPVRWRETQGLPPLRRTEAGGVTTVTLAMDDVRAPVLPAHAPPRFQHGREVEFTTLADWKAVAGAMAPLYAKAAELAPRSSVAARAAAIAASTTDPKARAGAALRLVEGEVRYLAHVEASGGYTPQSADETWRLRYGDCKAKTALLLALLHELGVPAAPVLASTTSGDGLDARLPSLGRFDHVLVRVSLGHRDYWLDGARQGDRGLDDLETPALGWVLPLDTGDGRLVHLVPEPGTRPQMVQTIRYDASAGATAPVPTQLKTTFRGDAAFVLQAQLAAVPPERLQAALKAYWAGVHSAFTAAHVAAAWDPDLGEETLTADGTSKLQVSDAGIELQHVELGGAPDIKRDPAANDPDAPYAVPFPNYVEIDESVVTPPGSTPSPDSLEGVSVNAIVGGVDYRRSGSFTGHVFTVVASQRALRPEISAAEARASVDPLTKLGARALYVNVKTTTATNPAAAIDSHPTTLDGHLDRGNALLDAGRFQEALGEFDAAIGLDPQSQTAWADRAVAHAWLADPTAGADADKADALGPPEIVAARARAILAATTGDAHGARAAYGRALALAPGDAFSLTHLIDLDLAAGEVDAARGHLGALLNAHPDEVPRAPLWNALIEHAAHHHAAAERELSDAPWWTSEQRVERARVYLAIGDKSLARADLDASIHLQPSIPALILRADLEGPESLAARADAEAAMKLDPRSAEPRLWLVKAALHRWDFPAALALIDELVSEHPERMGTLLVERAQIYGRLGRVVEMDADFTRAEAMTGATAPQPGYLCGGATKAKWRPENTLEACKKALDRDGTSTSLRLDEVILLHRLGREAEAMTALGAIETTTSDAGPLNEVCYDLAVENMALDRALADCDASLKLKPGVAATLDSRGFVLMRLGRDTEALAAYDAALAVNPKLYISLYGRGLVETRLGRQADGARDISAALAAQPHVRDQFADYGLR
jgi:tetratricopeptide (TPR) repeat protein